MDFYMKLFRAWIFLHWSRERSSLFFSLVNRPSSTLALKEQISSSKFTSAYVPLKLIVKNLTCTEILSMICELLEEAGKLAWTTKDKEKSFRQSLIWFAIKRAKVHARNMTLTTKKEDQNTVLQWKNAATQTRLGMLGSATKNLSLALSFDMRMLLRINRLLTTKYI